MIILDKRKYERIVSDLIDAKDIRDLAERYALDRVYYYHILKDITLGERSPNYNLLKGIAKKRRLREDFVIEQAKSILNFFVPYYQGLQTDSLDYYKILNVQRNATDEEIRRSWIELMKAHHPDMAGAEGLDTSKRINEAYEVLSSSSKREAYDNRHLPPTSVIVPQSEMKKYYYAGALMIVVFLAVMYASGSGLIFQSPEEKERLAREFEAPDMPNTVYKGDYLDSEEVDKKISEIKPIEETNGTGEMAAAGTDESSVTAGDKVSEAPEESAPAEKIEVAEAGPVEEAAHGESTVKPAPEAIKDNAAAEVKENAAIDARAEKTMEITGVTKDEPEKETSPADLTPAEVKTPDNESIASKTEHESPAPDNKEAGKEALTTAAAGNGEKDDETAAEEVTMAASKSETVKDEQKPAGEIVIAKNEKEPEMKPVSKPEEPVNKKGEITELAVPESEKTPSGDEYYTVRKGDSLWSIAHKFGKTTGELESLNGNSGGKLKIGDRVLISGTPVLRPEPLVAAAPKKAEPAPVTPLKAEKSAAAVTPKAVTPVKPPVKSDITADFNPNLATSAVAVRNTPVRAPQPVTPAAPPDRESIYGFVSDYVSAYKNRDIEKVKALFLPDAIENGVSISRVISSYSSNFSNLDIMKYDVKVNGISVENGRGNVRGEFFITFKDQRTGTLKNSKGTISWMLYWTGGSWKIRELTYKIENTDTMG